MATFNEAIPIILQHEGGYVNDPDDPGGATKWGISLRYLKTLDPSIADIDRDGDVDVEDVRRMTKDQAKEFYRKGWWEKYRYALIGPQYLATKVFDLAVNMGPSRAHRLLQWALRAVGRPVKVDGIIGPKTRAAIEDNDPYYIQGDDETSYAPGTSKQTYLPIASALRAEASAFYRSLVTADPGREKWLEGWLNRAYW